MSKLLWPSQSTAWETRTFPGTGTFLVTPAGVKLCRLGQGTIFFHDKRRKHEVEVSLDTLRDLVDGEV